MHRPSLRAFALALAVVAVASSPVHAQTYPTRPVKVVVPYSPGGGTDVLTRPLAQRLGEITGQPFVVENKPGADASIGAAMVAKAPADGYTVVAVSGIPFLLNQSAYKDLPYDTMRDLVPVAVFAALPMVLVGAPGFDAADAKALVAYAKANPKKLNYAGTDQMTYLGMEMIAKGTGTEMTYVPYKGAGPALTDLLGNHIQLMLSSASAAMPYIKEKRMKAFAVASNKRMASLPDVPTVSETIYPGYELNAWFGIFVPAGTPQPVIDKLAADIAAALKTPEVAQRLEGLGSDNRFLGPVEFRDFLARENARWSKAFKDSGMTPQ